MLKNDKEHAWSMPHLKSRIAMRSYRLKRPDLSSGSDFCTSFTSITIAASSITNIFDWFCSRFRFIRRSSCDLFYFASFLYRSLFVSRIVAISAVRSVIFLAVHSLYLEASICYVPQHGCIFVVLLYLVP